jgi:hypothetical protein
MDATRRARQELLAEDYSTEFRFWLCDFNEPLDPKDLPVVVPTGQKETEGQHE